MLSVRGSWFDNEAIQERTVELWEFLYKHVVIEKSEKLAASMNTAEDLIDLLVRIRDLQPLSCEWVQVFVAFEKKLRKHIEDNASAEISNQKSGQEIGSTRQDLTASALIAHEIKR